MPSSLRRQLLLLWATMVVICCALAVLLYGLYGQTEGVKLAQSRQQMEDACGRIVQRYNTAGTATRLPGNVTGLRDVVLQLVLADFNGVEGGIWTRQQGFVGYAYPTYQASGIKSDVPAAERANIETTARKALDGNKTALYTRSSDREVLLLAACPLDADSTAWTMTRVATVGSGFYQSLVAGMAMLLVLVIASAVIAGFALRRWDRKLAQVESALMHADTTTVPDIPVTGSTELDRLGTAVTGYAKRLSESRAIEARLTAELARHERLVTLGRMVATVAHEIRNPIATMQLTAENALADPQASDTAHLCALLTQIQRLNGVVESMLTMVQPIHLQLREVAIEPWLQEIIDHYGNQAIELRPMEGTGLVWRLDPDHMARAIENLLRNAVQHGGSDVPVYLEARRASGGLNIAVVNGGTEIPAELSDQLFEPFVSGRADGHGLGLALVREIVQAHQGTVVYSHRNGHTYFTVELPWRAS